MQILRGSVDMLACKAYRARKGRCGRQHKQLAAPTGTASTFEFRMAATEVGCFPDR